MARDVDVDDVLAVSALMDERGVGADDMLLLWHIENKYGEYSPEYVEPSPGDTKFVGTIEHAWTALAAHGTILRDTFQDSADAVHDALINEGFLVDHEAEEETEYRVTLDTMAEQYVYHVDAWNEDDALSAAIERARNDGMTGAVTDSRVEAL